MAEISAGGKTQKEDCGEEEEFVGQWIKQSAELGLLVILPRHITVETVTEGSQDEAEHAAKTVPFISALLIRQNFEDKKRNHQNPDEGDFVGGGHGVGSRGKGQLEQADGPIEAAQDPFFA